MAEPCDFLRRVLTYRDLHGEVERCAAFAAGRRLLVRTLKGEVSAEIAEAAARDPEIRLAMDNAGRRRLVRAITSKPVKHEAELLDEAEHLAAEAERLAGKISAVAAIAAPAVAARTVSWLLDGAARLASREPDLRRIAADLFGDRRAAQIVADGEAEGARVFARDCAHALRPRKVVVEAAA